MSKKHYLIIFLLSFTIASVLGNFTEKKVRSWIEVVYEVVMGKPMTNRFIYDEKGVPYVIENKIGKHWNPMTVCNTALSYYDKYKLGDSSQLTLFLNCADWLTGDLIKKDDFAVLKYSHNFPMYHLEGPWRSGLANGVSLQVFIKAHAVTQDEKYLIVAKQILNSFYVEVSDGGVTYKSEDKGWWYEEFADEGGYVSRVLNGHMFALLGIHEYFTYTNDSSALYLFNQGVMALKDNLPKYDNNVKTSYYDLRGTFANVKYHNIHVELLTQLFEISPDPTFKFYRDKWGAYEHPSLTKRLVTPPVKNIDIAIWLAIFAPTGLLVSAIFYLFRKKTNVV